MPDRGIDDVEGWIDGAREGDEEAVAALFTLAYDELRGLAHALRRSESGETLNTTGLVHEAWVKIVAGRSLSVESLAHFKHVVARAMRQVLVEQARARAAEKRGGEGRLVVTLMEDVHGRVVDELALLELHEALEELEAVDPRSARVVEARFFGGLDVEETASSLGVSTATVKRDWRVARAWLAQALA